MPTALNKAMNKAAPNWRRPAVIGSKTQQTTQQPMQSTQQSYAPQYQTQYPQQYATETKPQATEVVATTRLALKENGTVVEVPDYTVTRSPVDEPMRLKDLIQEIGVADFQDDEYDIPTFLRKQAD